MVAIIIIGLLALGIVLTLIRARKYKVVRMYADKAGEPAMEVLKRSWSIDDALRFVEGYDFHYEDRGIAVLNTSRKSEIVRDNDNLNPQLVFYATADGSRKGSHVASTYELDKIEEILDLVSKEVAAKA